MDKRLDHRLVRIRGLDDATTARALVHRLGETNEESEAILAGAIMRGHGEPIDVHSNRETHVMHSDQVSFRANRYQPAVLGPSNHVVADHSRDVIDDPPYASTKGLESACSAARTAAKARAAASTGVIARCSTRAIRASSNLAAGHTTECGRISARSDKNEDGTIRSDRPPDG